MAATGNCYIASITPVGHNQYSVTVKFDIAFDWGGYNNNGVNWVIYIDGYEKASGRNTFNVPSGGGNFVWANLCSATFTISMPTSGQARTVHVKGYVDTRVNPPSITAESDYTLPARYWLWTVKYNANGGYGAPSAQTKNYGVDLRLSSVSPKRDGHKFLGWATSADSAVQYRPGDPYRLDTNITLYAKWQINTYSVVYASNGGLGGPAIQTKTYGIDLKLSTVKPTRTNYNFLGWGLSGNATSVAYAPGATYKENSDVYLYAIWQLAYSKPRITNLRADRCNSGGALSEEGQYAKVTFNWATDRTVSGLTVVCNGVTTSPAKSGTSGSVSVVIGANALSTENSYTVTAKVSDSGGSTSLSTTISPLSYTMDVKAGGRGVAFGCPAITDYQLNTAWQIQAQNGMYVTGGEVNLRNKIKLTVDGEGGNIRIFSPNGSQWEMDSYNNAHFRIFTYAADESNKTYFPFTLDRGGIQTPRIQASAISHPGTLTISSPDTRFTGLIQGQMNYNSVGGSWISGRDRAMIRNNGKPGTGTFAAMVAMGCSNGYWTLGTLGNECYLSYTSDANYSSSNNVANSVAFRSDGTISPNSIPRPVRLVAPRNVAQGNQIGIPSTDRHNYIIMCGVSGGYTQCVIPKSYRGRNRVVNYYANGTAVTFEFNLTSDTVIAISRIYKEGAWSSYSATMEIWAF